jgi:ATP/ADP translocase
MSILFLSFLFDRYQAAEAMRFFIPVNIHGMVSLALMDAVIMRSSEIGSWNPG